MVLRRADVLLRHWKCVRKEFDSTLVSFYPLSLAEIPPCKILQL